MLARATPAELARIPRIEPNCGQGDHSRLSCSAGDTQLGTGFCRDLQQAFCTDVGHHAASPRRHELAAISFVQKMIRRRQKPATPLLSLRWTLRAKRACVVITDAEPDRLAPLTPPAPIGLRGVWVVAARCFAPALRRAVAPTLLRGVLHV